MKFNNIATSLTILCLLASQASPRPAPHLSQAELQELAKWVGRLGVTAAAFYGAKKTGEALADIVGHFLGYDDDEGSSEEDDPVMKKHAMREMMFSPKAYGMGDDTPPGEGDSDEDSDEKADGSDQLSAEMAYPVDQEMRREEEKKRKAEEKKQAENVGKDQVTENKKDQVPNE